MRIGELTIYQEGEPQEFDLEAAQRSITMLPGRIAVAPDKPRTQYESILLPEITSERERPDCGTVVAVGGNRILQSAETGADIPVRPGERVLLRPCKGKWVRDFQSSDGSFGLPEIRFYGVTWDLSHEIMAVHRGGSWQPLYDWLIIKRESNEESEGGVLIANPGNKTKRQRATVLNVNPNYSYGVRVGDVVLVDDHPNTGLTFAYGDLADCEIVKQVDEDGWRTCFAIVGEAV